MFSMLLLARCTLSSPGPAAAAWPGTSSASAMQNFAHAYAAPDDAQQASEQSKHYGAPIANAGRSDISMQQLSQRVAAMHTHFPGAIALDDYLMRAQIALATHGFSGDSALSLTNVCRDEATAALTTRLDSVFGASFRMCGLGACLTCGRLGALAAQACQSDPHDGPRPKLGAHALRRLDMHLTVLHGAVTCARLVLAQKLQLHVNNDCFVQREVR
jgi:Limiting CO2-inducible proteins B/C beta carbonyic anhydrases